MTYEEWIKSKAGQDALIDNEGGGDGGLRAAWNGALAAAAQQVLDDAPDYWPTFDALRAGSK